MHAALHCLCALLVLCTCGAALGWGDGKGENGTSSGLQLGEEELERLAAKIVQRLGSQARLRLSLQ